MPYIRSCGDPYCSGTRAWHTCENVREVSVEEMDRFEELSDAGATIDLELSAFDQDMPESTDNDDNDDNDDYAPYTEDGPERTSDSDHFTQEYLLNYSYRPELEFRGGDPDDPEMSNTPHYGMELELNTRDVSTALEIIGEHCHGPERNGLIYAKEDSSVRGLELVTHPMTHKWAMEYFPWDMLTELESRANCHAEADSNGIHIHVSRAGFTDPVHMYRWMKFIYRNQVHITRIAGRPADHWGVFNKNAQKGQIVHCKPNIRRNVPKPGEYEIGAIERQARSALEYRQRDYDNEVSYFNREYGEGSSTAIRYIDSMIPVPGLDELVQSYTDNWVREHQNRDTTRMDRYNAINTVNRNTLEVRVFASTTRPSVAKQRFQLISASVEYTRNLTASKVIKDKGWAWEGFRAYLADNAGTYPDLAWREERSAAT